MALSIQNDEEWAAVQTLLHDMRTGKAQAPFAALSGYAALLALAREMAEALEQCYDAVEWPADGTSTAEKTALKFREWERHNVRVSDRPE